MKKIVLVLLALLPFASAVDCRLQDCGGNLICSLSGLPNAIQCALVNGARDALASPFGKAMELARAFVVTTPPLAREASAGLYEFVFFVVSLLLFLALLLNAVKLVYASAFSGEERLESKEEIKRVFFNMLVVWIGFDLYALAVDAMNSVAAAVAPTQAEWAVGSPAIASLVLLVLLSPAIGFFVFSAAGRWLSSYLGFLLLIVALAFECFSLTRSFGNVLKKLVAANFVVQFVQALFLRVAASDLTGFGTTLGVADATARIVFAALVLFTAAVVSTLIYASALASDIMASRAGQYVVVHALLRKLSPNPRTN